MTQSQNMTSTQELKGYLRGYDYFHNLPPDALSMGGRL